MRNTIFICMENGNGFRVSFDNFVEIHLVYV